MPARPDDTAPPTGIRANALLWTCLLVLVVSALAWWWQLGRPVVLPDAPSSRIACVSYAPFRRSDQTPFDATAVISPAQIDTDMQALAQRFNCVRTYSQAHGLDAVPAIAGRYGLKVLLGIWIDSLPADNAREIAQGIATAKAHPDVVRGVIVGNEVLLRGEQTPEHLIGFIRQVRAALPATLPVTYADVWEDWLRYPQMAKSVDYLTAHILPYWEDQPVPVEQAVSHLATVYAQLQRAFPGRRIMIGETGWPSAGRPRQQSIASRVSEARYIREFLLYTASNHLPYNVIETFDQPWKRNQEGTVGGYWGIFDSAARPKFPMQGPVVEEPRWWLGWIGIGAGALAFLLLGGRRQRPCEALALLLFGAASGGALAWQWRQMWFACGIELEWLIAGGSCLLALFTALLLVRPLAQRLAGTQSISAPSPMWLRATWLFMQTLYSILLVWNGRYRDFPLGAFELPCLAYLLTAWFLGPARLPAPLPEERFMSMLLPVLGLSVVVQEAGQSISAWLWFGLSLALSLPVWLSWRHPARLQPHQA